MVSIPTRPPPKVRREIGHQRRRHERSTFVLKARGDRPRCGSVQGKKPRADGNEEIGLRVEDLHFDARASNRRKMGRYGLC